MILQGQSDRHLLLSFDCFVINVNRVDEVEGDQMIENRRQNLGGFDRRICGSHSHHEDHKRRAKIHRSYDQPRKNQACETLRKNQHFEIINSKSLEVFLRDRRAL